MNVIHVREGIRPLDRASRYSRWLAVTCLCGRSRLTRDEFLLECYGGEEAYFIRSQNDAIRLIHRVPVDRRFTSREDEDLACPYAVISLPLTLLSASVILWKRRREPPPEVPAGRG